jgi:hypothetical protein
MHCAFCRREMMYVHGHAACVNNQCPMFGMNQAECCSGETAETCPVVVIDRQPVAPATGYKR